MTWPKFFDSKWFERLFTITLAIIVVLITQNIIAKREYNVSLKSQFDERPTKIEVNKQVDNLQIYVDKQDENLEKKLLQHIEEDKKANETLITYIKSIDRNVNSLLNREK